MLLHLVRNIYPDVPAVYVDTGLEFPEIRSFVKTVENTVWLRPEMNFRNALEKHGYPVVSKKQAQYIRELRHTKSENMRRLRLTGIRKDGSFSPMARISKKWHYLMDAPFEISERCCDVMKKKPFDRFHAKSGLIPYVGTMAAEGGNREKSYLMYGCNTYEAKRPQSKPISFWREEDVWEYIRQNDIPYSPIYDMGYDRTGCVFCAFGAHLEKTPNRFQRLKTTHPKLWNYCMSEDGLNMHAVLEYCGIETGRREFGIQQDFFQADPVQQRAVARAPYSQEVNKDEFRRTN